MAIRMSSLTAVFVIAATAATAQQAPPTDWQRVIPVLEAQRNQALSNHAIASARAAQLEEENTKLKTELEELKKAAPK